MLRKRKEHTRIKSSRRKDALAGFPILSKKSTPRYNLYYAFLIINALPIVIVLMLNTLGYMLQGGDGSGIGMLFAMILVVINPIFYSIGILLILISAFSRNNWLIIFSAQELFLFYTLNHFGMDYIEIMLNLNSMPAYQAMFLSFTCLLAIASGKQEHTAKPP